MKVKLLLFLALLAIVGCTKVRYVTVTNTLHDTLTQYKTDSVIQQIFTIEKFIERDSISHVEYVKGDTIHIRDFEIIYREREKEMSKERLETIRDSLREIILSSEYKPIIEYKDKYIERDFTKKEKFLMAMGKFSSWAFGIIALLGILWIGIKKNLFVKLLKLFK